MSRAARFLPLAGLVLAACAAPTPAPQQPAVLTDTVYVTREVPPPLPEGRTTSICLGNGQNVQVRVTEAGDTLIGPKRIRLLDLGPSIGFVGNYAGGELWFIRDEPITFGSRQYSKFGQPEVRDCGSMKIVGDIRGVNLFAEADASEPFRALYVPVRAGVFQPYRTEVGRVRG